MLIQKEIDRYSGIKLDLEQDISSTRKMQKRLEDVSGPVFPVFVRNNCFSFRFMRRCRIVMDLWRATGFTQGPGIGGDWIDEAL